MAAAKVMDILLRLPECAGQAAHTLSVCTQFKMEYAPTLLKIPKSECPDIWIRLPKHKWHTSWSSMEDPVLLLEQILYGHFLARLLWERQIEQVLLNYGWEKVPNGELLFFNREKGLFLSVYVDDIKLAGKTQNINPLWKILMKDVHALNVNANRTNMFLMSTDMFESRISAGATEKLFGWEKSHANTIAWSCDTDCELANKTNQQLYTVSTPRLDDHHFKKEDVETVVELPNGFSQIVQKWLYLARIGGPDILRSVNKLARAITKWAGACGKRLALLISYILNTGVYKQYCHVGNTAQHCRFGLFQDSDFAEDSEDSKSTSGVRFHKSDV